jgi:hypothetical protein
MTVTAEQTGSTSRSGSSSTTNRGTRTKDSPNGTTSPSSLRPSKPSTSPQQPQQQQEQHGNININNSNGTPAKGNNNNNNNNNNYNNVNNPPTPSERSADRDPFFASRDTVDYKWQRSKNVVGALEVDSEPVFNPRTPLKPRYKDGYEDKFREALQAWDDLKLRPSFIKACDDELQDEMCCCGLVLDPDATKKQYVRQLNDTWVKNVANKQLSTRGYKVDTFVWNWQNASGKSETNIVLIRFYTVSTFGFIRASDQGSLDVQDMLHDHDISVTNYDDNDNDNGTATNVEVGTKADAVKSRQMTR